MMNSTETVEVFPALSTTSNAKTYLPSSLISSPNS